MSLLVATDTKLKELCPPQIEGQYFELEAFGVFQVVSKAHLSSMAIKTTYEDNSFFVSASDIFEALLMVEL